MAKEIVYYETTKSYGRIMKGLRFKVIKDSSKHIDACIKEGLSDQSAEHRYARLAGNGLKQCFCTVQGVSLAPCKSRLSCIICGKYKRIFHDGGLNAH